MTPTQTLKERSLNLIFALCLVMISTKPANAHYVCEKYYTYIDGSKTVGQGFPLLFWVSFDDMDECEKAQMERQKWLDSDDGWEGFISICYEEEKCSVEQIHKRKIRNNTNE